MKKNRKKSQLVDFQHDKNGKKLGKLENFAYLYYVKKLRLWKIIDYP